MLNLLSFSFLFFAVVAAAQWNRENSSRNKLFLVAYATLVITALSLQVEPSDEVKYLILIQSCIIITAGFWPMHFTEKFRQLKWLVPSLFLFPMLFIGGQQYSIGDFSFSVNSSLLPLMFLGTLVPALESYSLSLLRTIVGSLEEESARTALDLFFVGFAAFVGHFFALHLGILAIGVGLVLSEGILAYENKKSLVLLHLAVAFSFVEPAGLEAVDLSMGKVLQGCMFGLLCIYFLNAIIATSKGIITRLILGVCMSLVLFFLLYFLGTQKTDLGGKDAFIAAMIGSSIGILLNKNTTWTLIFVSALAAEAFYVLPDEIIQNETPDMLAIGQVSSKTKLQKEDKSSLFTVKGNPIDDLVGRSFRIDEKNVILNFHLGPKGGITKGLIRSLSGSITFGSKGEDVDFDVQIPVIQLSTKNKYRDESLMSKDYFDEEQFPFMKFEANKLEKREDHYLLKGAFTMLGKKNPLDIQLKYVVDKNGNSSLIGMSSIDRTKFGMQPDSREGNIVDFEFQIPLLED